MKIKFACWIFLSSILAAVLYLPVLADSPLTSTDFYNAYLDIPQVKNARGVGMNEKIFAYLINPQNPLDQRVAVINAMGWKFEGNHNGEAFIELMAKKLGKTSSELKTSDLNGEELLCLGYMLALDDYFKLSPAKELGGELETTGALKLIEKASAMLGENFTAQLISSLVKSELVPVSDWGEIYLLTKKVIDSGLKRNMRDEAVNIITDYTDLYKEYCEHSTIMASALKIKPLKTVEVKTGVADLDFSPDKTGLLTTNGNETKVRVWNVEAGQQVTILDSGEFTDCHIFSRDGKWILISDLTPQVLIYSSKDYSHVRELKFDSRVMDIAISPSGSQIAFACFDGTVQIYSASTWKNEKFIQAHKKYVSTIRFSGDGKYLLTGSYDRSVKLWDIQKDYSLIYECKNFSEGTFAYFLPGDKKILVRDYANYIKILDASTGDVIWEKALPATVHDVSCDPKGTLIAAATEMGAVYLWNWEKDTGPLIFLAHDDQATGVKFVGDKLYTCGLDNKWKIWDVKGLENNLNKMNKK